MANPTYTPLDAKSLRIALGQTAKEFGLTLRRATHPRATRGYSHAYVIMIEHGRKPLAGAILAAYLRVRAQHERRNPEIEAAVRCEVLAQTDISGALVVGEPRLCARPGCGVRFIARRSSQRFCGRWCQKAAGR